MVNGLPNGRFPNAHCASGSNHPFGGDRATACDQHSPPAHADAHSYTPATTHANACAINGWFCHGRSR